MTPLAFLLFYTLGVAGGFALGWLARGFEVDDLTAEVTRLNKERGEDLKEWLALHRKYTGLKFAASDAIPHLKSIPRMQETGFHLARTVKHLEQRLAKFGPKPRGEGGRFLKSTSTGKEWMNV